MQKVKKIDKDIYSDRDGAKISQLDTEIVRD